MEYVWVVVRHVAMNESTVSVSMEFISDSLITRSRRSLTKAMVGHSGAIRMILAFDYLNFLRTCFISLSGGKAYANKLSQSIDNASTTCAM